MKDKCGISIVIPFYKGHKYIKKTIKSLVNSINETYLPYEIIIVNDSPGENLGYLNQIFCDNNLIIIHNVENYGIAKTRNIGKDISNYPYIYFIDQDDWVKRSFFHYVKEYIKKDFDCIFFNVNKYCKGKFKKKYNIFFKILLKYWLNEKKLLKYGNFFSTIGQSVFKKEIINDFIETDIMGSDDKFMYIDIFSKKEKLKIKYVNKPVINYRLHVKNYSNKANFEKSTFECFEIYAKNNPEIASMKNELVKYYNNNFMSIVMSKIIKKIITFNIF